MAKEKGVSTLIGIIIIVAAAVVAFGGVFAYQYLLKKKGEPVIIENNQPIVGNDRDAHGCIGSAGYSWCEAKQKCLRTWEEPCEENNAMTEQTAREIAQNSSACQQYLSAD